MHDSVTVHMAAPPDRVWALVSDVTRIGSYSPETFEAEWIDGATGPAVGASFRGHVKRNGKGPIYWTTCTVTECVPGSTFAFGVGAPGKTPLNVWRYDIVSGRRRLRRDRVLHAATDAVPAPLLGRARLVPRQDQPQRDAHHARADPRRGRGGAGRGRLAAGSSA